MEPLYRPLIPATAGKPVRRSTSTRIDRAENPIPTQAADFREPRPGAILAEATAKAAAASGVVLRADVFRPAASGKHPVILSYGRYAKGLALSEGFERRWKRLVEQFPEVVAELTAESCRNRVSSSVVGNAE